MGSGNLPGDDTTLPMCTVLHHLYCAHCTGVLYTAQHTGSPCHMSGRGGRGPRYAQMIVKYHQQNINIHTHWSTSHSAAEALSKANTEASGQWQWDGDKHLIDPHLQPVLLMQKRSSAGY